MVKYSAEKVVTRATSSATMSSSRPTDSKPTTPLISPPDSEPSKAELSQPQPQTKIAYYSAGSGIPEVKVILAGFVIKGFLGIKTLIVKSVGMVNTKYILASIRIYRNVTHNVQTVPLDFLDLFWFDVRKRRTVRASRLFRRQYILPSFSQI